VPDYEHLSIRRVQRPPRQRQKVRQGFRREPRYTQHEQHARDLSAQAEEALAALQVRQTRAAELNPKLMLTFDLNRKVPEDRFRVSGLTVLDSSDQHAAVVFASDGEMAAFKRRLALYRRGPVERALDLEVDDAEGPEEGDDEPQTRSARYEDFFDAIDGFRPLDARDRISPRLESRLDEAGGGRIPFNVDLWFAEDEAVRADWLEEAQARVFALEGRWLDTFADPVARVLVARVAGDRAVIEGLAELDQVALLDAVAQPNLRSDELADLQDLARLPDTVRPPSPNAPVVGLVDSGLTSGHPLLEPATLASEALHHSFGGRADDEYGHGTALGGLLLYGDVLAAARAGHFEPSFWLASVRVLDHEGYEPENANTVKLITDAIRHLVEEYECRVINLSFGDPSSPYIGGKTSALAAALDTAIRRYSLLLIVSAGNLYFDQLAPQAQMLGRWPEYLTDAGFEIVDPAQAALAITVGALSRHDAASGDHVHRSVVASAGGPAPFTRHGPGVLQSIKPELAADGGNWVFDRRSNAPAADHAVEVISTSNRYPEELLAANLGTSVAAGQIAHIAGLLETAYPDLDPLTWRALLLQGAEHEDGMVDAFDHLEGADHADALHSVAGYGQPSWERCGLSQDNRVVLYAEDELLPDGFHVYRLPVTRSFAEISGPRSLAVSLTFNPPVRYRRLDYLGHQMEFLVVRGLDEDDVFRMADADVANAQASELSKKEVTLHPSRTARRRGTNQFARHDWRQRLSSGVDGDWFLVVRSLSKWLTLDDGMQAYSLAVSYEVDQAEQLYSELQIALRAQLQAQIQLRT
jgi:Subtilase family